MFPGVKTGFHVSFGESEGLWWLLPMQDNVVRKIRFFSYLKCTASVRLVTYGVSGDLVDEYMRICIWENLHGLNQCTTSLKLWSRCLVENIWEIQMLPTQLDREQLTSQEGFLGCLEEYIACNGSVKTIHLLDSGNIREHVGEYTIIFEVVTSHNLWIWYSLFGMIGSHNNINVVQRSPVFSNLEEGYSLVTICEINDH
jgi:hypothetical protein